MGPVIVGDTEALVGDAEALPISEARDLASPLTSLLISVRVQKLVDLARRRQVGVRASCR